jgi:hypothetical protein
MSIAVTSNILLTLNSLSFSSSLDRSAQHRIQCVPLKITYKHELVFDLWKTTLFRHNHKAQHRADVPINTWFLNLNGKFLSQEPKRFAILLGGCILKDIQTIFHIKRAIWQSKNKCWIVSLLLQKQHWTIPFQFLLTRLSLVRMTPCFRYQRKTLSWVEASLSN